ncbi:hypothetical protein H5410_003574 [Solanum commersonii]|uniref:ZP domain-containing protein n=1 Tax=Solanum commersonii TaxID=4109 RepID=A0A9J6B599_SOLCO|nr:hypothetical protein H5410_003574 [Solanum commersonii]
MKSISLRLILLFKICISITYRQRHALQQSFIPFYQQNYTNETMCFVRFIARDPCPRSHHYSQCLSPSSPVHQVEYLGVVGVEFPLFPSSYIAIYRCLMNYNGHRSGDYGIAKIKGLLLPNPLDLIRIDGSTRSIQEFHMNSLLYEQQTYNCSFKIKKKATVVKEH